MLHHIACEGYGQIVAQPFLANFGRKRVAIPLVGLFGRNATEEVARVEDFEQQLVSFVAVLAQQRGEVFHRRVSSGWNPQVRNTLFIVSKM